jgi:hypothetical protein
VTEHEPAGVAQDFGGLERNIGVQRGQAAGDIQRIAPVLVLQNAQRVGIARRRSKGCLAEDNLAAREQGFEERVQHGRPL